MIYRVEGIITQIHQLGESDKIVTIYTKERGRIKAVAKGARKPKSKMAGRIELFCQNSFIIAKGKSLDIISQADMLQNFYIIRNDYNKIMLASFIARTINKVVLPELKSAELYHLLTECYKLLTSYDDYGKIKQFFQQKFLQIEGLSSGEKIRSDRIFDKLLDYHFELATEKVNT